jgi:hypothetical protein
MHLRMSAPRWGIGLLLLTPTLCPAAVETGVEPETGLRYWQWEGEGVIFRLTQRLPDQTRAFFLARGFDPQSADLLATNCVFQSMFQNAAAEGSASVRFDLRDWRILVDDTPRRLKDRDYWAEVWASRDLPQPARIAFEWSLLPTTQEYAPGDYNWGMTSYGLAPGLVFDLQFSWSANGTGHRARIEGIECAPDIHPEGGVPAL